MKGYSVAESVQSPKSDEILTTCDRANNLVETIKTLPEERQAEVRKFIDLLGMSEEVIAVAMEWITDPLPDRYCVDDPRFDVQNLHYS